MATLTVGNKYMKKCDTHWVMNRSEETRGRETGEQTGRLYYYFLFLTRVPFSTSLVNSNTSTLFYLGVSQLGSDLLGLNRHALHLASLFSSVGF